MPVTYAGVLQVLLLFVDLGSGVGYRPCGFPTSNCKTDCDIFFPVSQRKAILWLVFLHGVVWGVGCSQGYRRTGDNAVGRTPSPLFPLLPPLAPRFSRSAFNSTCSYLQSMAQTTLVHFSL
ncbi:unnamed protein product [Ectocarpus sp. 12 AP-2014]